MKVANNTTTYEEKKTRLHKVVSKLVFKKHKQIYVGGPIRIKKDESKGDQFLIMDKALSTVVRYALQLKMTWKVFCNRIRMKIIQERARQAGHIFIKDGSI